MVGFINKHKLSFEQQFDYINYETRILMCAYSSFLRDFAIDIKKNKVDDYVIDKNLTNIKKFREIILKKQIKSDEIKQSNNEHHY